MNKIKNFFNSIEERFVFPVSRRTWQIMALLAIVLLVFSILYFVINSTPTSRDKVTVSKEEVTENKVDTSVRVQAEARVCSKAEISAYTDSLRRITPNNEWVNLGDSSEPYNDYLVDEYGNYLMDGYGNYVFIEKRSFRANELAVPNMIESIYQQRGLDTGAICSRLEVIKTLYRLSKNTTSEYLQSGALKVYANLLSQRISINEELAIKTFSFKEKTEGYSSKISDFNMAKQYINYLEYLSDNNIDDEKISIAVALVSSHKKLPNKSILSDAEYFELVKMIFDTRLPNEDLGQAIPEFQDDIAFYDEKGLSKSLRRYLRLYQEKLSMAESEKQRTQSEKSAKKSKSIAYAMYAFISIVGIATILLLFSIQSILKNNFQDKKE